MVKLGRTPWLSWVERHNLCAGFEDQLKTLNVDYIWHDFHKEDSSKSMMKHKLDDLGGMK